MAVRPPVPRVFASGALLLLAGLIAAVSPAPADVVTIAPRADNTLFADAQGDTSNGAGPALFAGNNAQGLTRRALLRFDLAARVPAGAQIDSVVLALHVSNSPNLQPRSFTLHRVQSAWGEGTSFATGGAGAPATPGDATWLHASFPDRSWSAPGGDFDPEPSASLLVEGPGDYVASALGMTADVRRWRESPHTNFGWLVRGEENAPSTARRFDSRECGEEQNRPSLTIYYTLPAVPAVSWGGVRSRYR